MKCLDCKKDLIQLPKKRVKQFCNSTCRSNYWAKAKRNNGVVKPKKEKQKSTQEPEKKPDLPKGKWVLKERPTPPPGLTGLALRIWKDNHK